MCLTLRKQCFKKIIRLVFPLANRLGSQFANWPDWQIGRNIYIIHMGRFVLVGWCELYLCFNTWICLHLLFFFANSFILPISMIHFPEDAYGRIFGVFISIMSQSETGERGELFQVIPLLALLVYSFPDVPFSYLVLQVILILRSKIGRKSSRQVILTHT